MQNNLKKQIAIQGGKGSFHEIAAMFHFGGDNIKTFCFSNFNDLVKSVETNNVDYGLMAIENTVAGSLIGNYALLENHSIKVIGEVLLRIEQNLLSIPGQTIHDINEVFSHPIALMQCSEFFNNYQHIRLIESEDTAMSAERISKQNILNAGAIASQRAADLFGLTVLKAGIETNKRNFTRFLVIKGITSNQHDSILIPDKSSISFTLPHKTGSLSNVLSIFSSYDINLTKIQSIPILGKEWEYHFIVDLTFDNFEIYNQSIAAIKPLTAGFQVFGEYQKANQYYKSNQVSPNLELETIEII